LIGVLAAECHLWAVREFFELFKTPWEFCRNDRRYAVVLSASPRADLPDADLTIIYGLEPGEEGNGPSQAGEMLNYRGRRFPVYCGCSTFQAFEAAFISREDTGRAVALETIGSRGKTVRIGYDLFGEVRFLLSRGQPVRNAGVPTLDLHISILRELIVDSGIPLVEIPPVPPGFDLILCLTHDVDFVRMRAHGVDRTVLGFLYRASALSLLRFVKGQLSLLKTLRNLLAVLTLPLVYLGLVPDFFDQFQHYRELEGSLRSTFFLIPSKNVGGQSPDGRNCTGRATRYQAEELRGETAALAAGGWEVGLHGLDAWHDAGKAGVEREAIARATGRQPLGVRIHWLWYSESTPLVLEKAGFVYDSTCGYNEGIGFRAGTAQVFRPAGADRLLELPLHVQDTSLFATGRMNLTQSQGIQAINEILQEIRITGGVCTVNWHMRSIGPERLWDEPYHHLLRFARQGRAWSAKAEEAVEWFALRRAASFSSADPDGGPIGTRRARSASLPGLLVRRYNMSGQGCSATHAEVLIPAGPADGGT